MGLVVFGFVLHHDQIEAIWTLFYLQKDLMLIAHPGFGKSEIFQLLPLMAGSIGVGLIVMPIKMMQTEQSNMINRDIPGGKAIVLKEDNNQSRVRKEIATGGYTHVFTSPEIALSKGFTNDILDCKEFTDRLRLLAIDEVHLVEEWGSTFRPRYAEISIMRKRIPCQARQVPLLGVSASLSMRD